MSVLQVMIMMMELNPVTLAPNMHTDVDVNKGGVWTLTFSSHWPCDIIVGRPATSDHYRQSILDSAPHIVLEGECFSTWGENKWKLVFAFYLAQSLQWALLHWWIRQAGQWSREEGAASKPCDQLSPHCDCDDDY